MNTGIRESELNEAMAYWGNVLRMRGWGTVAADILQEAYLLADAQFDAARGHSLKTFFGLMVGKAQKIVGKQLRAVTETVGRGCGAGGEFEVIGFDSPVHGDDEDGTVHDIIGSDYLAPDQAAARNEREETIPVFAERILSELNPKHQAAIRLTILDGKTLHEAAQVLGVSHQSVKNWVDAGLRQLRDAHGAEVAELWDLASEPAQVE
jgi:RNA polymerase sigma factor (sigma-70 family)